MKRILCILSSLNAGGAETFLMKVYRELPIEEYQIDFVVSVGNGCYTKEVLERGGRIYQIPMRTKDIVGAFRKIKAIVKENHYDTVLKLAENSLSVVDMIAAKLGGAHNLAVRSCNAPTDLSLKQRFIHRFFRPLLNFVTTVKLAPSQLAADFMFGKKASVKLLHNGLNLDLFCFDPQARLQIRNEFGLQDEFVVGHIGRFFSQKNHQYLLKIFREIHQQQENSVLLLIGVGELEEQIREWIKNLELEDHVIFAGQRFDIPELLSAMDVFVFPSFYEGMPNTIIEAQATGLPCVISDTITREADLTGLVHYLPLSDEPQLWAEKVFSVQTDERQNTRTKFIEKGYNIQDVAQELIGMISD